MTTTPSTPRPADIASVDVATAIIGSADAMGIEELDRVAVDLTTQYLEEPTKIESVHFMRCVERYGPIYGFWTGLIENVDKAQMRYIIHRLRLPRHDEDPEYR